MFFRREKPHQFTFEERLENLKPFKFDVKLEGPSRARISRRGCGAILNDLGEGKVDIGKAGVWVGSELAVLTSRGFQMFLDTPSGTEIPAQAAHLKALHAFDEDLREGLGLTSLYNLALGSTSEAHLYDRVKDRDSGPHPRPWDHHE